MISIQDISFSYRSKQLFSGMDLFLPGGGICGLLGKNGAGKTSLLKLMSGLLFPQQGALMVGGKIPSKRAPEFLEDLFFIPEEFKLPPVTPEKYRWLFAPFYPRFDTVLYTDFLEKFEVDCRVNLHQCSYGQRKKCLIAFGLASNCRLILLDEPTNGLDIPSKRQFRKLLASVLTGGRLFVIATHQVRDLESLIDPVVILDNGKIIFNHSLEEITSHLRVELMPALPETDSVLFSEKTIGGVKAVLADSNETGGFIDLETLFNTVIENPDQVAAVFEKEEYHAD